MVIHDDWRRWFTHVILDDYVFVVKGCVAKQLSVLFWLHVDRGDEYLYLTVDGVRRIATVQVEFYLRPYGRSPVNAATTVKLFTLNYDDRVVLDVNADSIWRFAPLCFPLLEKTNERIDVHLRVNAAVNGL